jgi:hypothetical protein
MRKTALILDLPPAPGWVQVQHSARYRPARSPHFAACGDCHDPVGNLEYSGLTPIATIVPEPGTLLLVLSGLGGLASFRARRGPAAPLREA